MGWVSAIFERKVWRALKCLLGFVVFLLDDWGSE